VQPRFRLQREVLSKQIERSPEVQYLPAVLHPVGEPPEDVGSSHPMRKITEAVADDPLSWTPLAAEQVAGFFDEMARSWAVSGNRARGQEVLQDLLSRSVLAADGVLIWVNSIGDRTPIHLSAERIAQALTGSAQFEVTASTARWGTWVVARCRPVT